MTYDEALALLTAHGQEHILAFWARLDEAARVRLLDQISKLDFVSIERMREMLGADVNESGATCEPAAVEILSGEAETSARAVGEQALREGRVGVLLVAGGQGSRLGFEGPKGAYPIGPLSDAPLFRFHARKILGLERTFGSRVPFYIMTSQANDADTRAFFESNDYFGLDPERVMFFTQGMWPALTEDGHIILDQPDHVFMSPDGHGGTLAALLDTGMIDDMEARGLSSVFYFQVDNPLVEVADPAFIGLHEQRDADISIKVCAKRDPEEGLGIVVERDGGYAMVEYSELTPEQMHARTPDGELFYKFGSVAIHVFSMAFMRAQAEAALPLHIAHKKVPMCDADGQVVTPDAPNAYKFEKFIFDVIPNARKVVTLAFDREEEFSPVKNATGADSPETCKRDLVRKAARWLESAGVSVPRNEEGEPSVVIELDPALAINPAALARTEGLPKAIDGDLQLG